MKLNPKYKIKPYSTWCYQLAAYRAALGVRATCINLIVNSVTPEPPVEHVWTESEMESGLRAFMAARELWNIENNYTPGGGPPGKAETLKTEIGKSEIVLTA